LILRPHCGAALRAFAFSPFSFLFFMTSIASQSRNRIKVYGGVLGQGKNCWLAPGSEPPPPAGRGGGRPPPLPAGKRGLLVALRKAVWLMGPKDSLVGGNERFGVLWHHWILPPPDTEGANGGATRTPGSRHTGGGTLQAHRWPCHPPPGDEQGARKHLCLYFHSPTS